MSGTVLITGASGGIGRRAVEAFEAAGWTVRRYDRQTDLTEAARGADVLFNGMNPPMYHDWPGEIPRITRQVIDAARATGATLLQPGNVYVYGTQPGPWTEATPHRAASRKGQVRIAAEEAFRDAAEQGVRIIILRAGDFIDPDNPQTLFNQLVLKSAAKGKVMATGRPDSVRAYAYLPDLARAMVALAERRAELPAYVEIGFPGYSLSYDDLARIVSEITGRPIRISRFPWWALRLASPFWELAREMGEMRYLHEMPHRVDGTRFREMFPDFTDTDLRSVVAAHLHLPGAVSGRAAAA